MVDTEAGMVGMEWVDGWSVREVLGGCAEGEEADPEEEEEGQVDEVKAARRKEAEAVLENLGVSVGTWQVLWPACDSSRLDHSSRSGF